MVMAAEVVMTILELPELSLGAMVLWVTYFERAIDADNTCIAGDTSPLPNKTGDVHEQTTLRGTDSGVVIGDNNAL
jgi:hypothetical protein